MRLRLGFLNRLFLLLKEKAVAAVNHAAVIAKIAPINVTETYKKNDIPFGMSFSV